MNQEQILGSVAADMSSDIETTLRPYYFTANCAKQLGRTAFHPDTSTLWCSLPASGIAFGFRGTTCILRLTADSAYQTGTAAAVRYAVYLNDKLISDAQLLEPERTVILHSNGDMISWVRLIKLSEAEHSALGIREICIMASPEVQQNEQQNIFVPAAPKPYLIEFIGDSITCGYGVDGQNGEVFQTANENAEKSFAYLTAKQLNADYSMVSYSGYGIISGYTADGIANIQHLLPPFYSLIGHGSAIIEERCRIDEDCWDFSIQPDLIVLNLGTNDASFTGTDAEKQNGFAKAYCSFLKTIREKNPAAPILCTLGIMGQTLCDAVELAVSRYITETCDSNIRTMRFAMQSESDGIAVDCHPSAVTHEKAAARLCNEIRVWLGW